MQLLRTGNEPIDATTLKSQQKLPRPAITNRKGGGKRYQKLREKQECKRLKEFASPRSPVVVIILLVIYCQVNNVIQLIVEYTYHCR